MEYVCIKVFAILLVNMRSIVCPYLYVKILQQMCLTYDTAITVCSLQFNYQAWEVQINDVELSANDISRLGVQSNIKSMLLLMLL